MIGGDITFGLSSIRAWSRSISIAFPFLAGFTEYPCSLGTPADDWFVYVVTNRLRHMMSFRITTELRHATGRPSPSNAGRSDTCDSFAQHVRIGRPWFLT